MATIMSASFGQPKHYSSSPKALQNPCPTIASMPSSRSRNEFAVEALMAITKSKNLSPVSNKRINNPINVIDNYDNFTYNIFQYIGELGYHFEVYRNDKLNVDELKRKRPQGVLISLESGKPRDSGISLETILELGTTVPLFGVCMGLQCIGETFGDVARKIVRSPYGVMHGKSSIIYYNEKGEEGLFVGLSKYEFICSL